MEAERPGSPPRSRDLPPLRLYHLFLWMTTAAVLAGFTMGMWRIYRDLYPSSFMREIDAFSAIHGTYAFMSDGAVLAIVLLGFFWRKKGLPFPSEPGHWIALYLVLSDAFQHIHSYVLPWFWQFPWMSSPGAELWLYLPYWCLAFFLWRAAYRKEHVRLWRFGWIVMMGRSGLMIFLYFAFLSIAAVEVLLETFWYNSPISSLWGRLLVFVPRSGFYWAMLLQHYCALGFLASGMVSDRRCGRKRHWSHWVAWGFCFMHVVHQIVWNHWYLAQM